MIVSDNDQRPMNLAQVLEDGLSLGEELEKVKAERDALAAQWKQAQAMANTDAEAGFDSKLIDFILMNDAAEAISLKRHNANWQAEALSAYPMQPLRYDDKGVIRFEENPIISYLAREVSNLNHIAIWCQRHDVPTKYQEQLAQLIGYSVSGYGTLSYVSDESFDRASAAVELLRGKHRQAERDGSNG